MFNFLNMIDGDVSSVIDVYSAGQIERISANIRPIRCCSAIWSARRLEVREFLKNHWVRVGCRTCRTSCASLRTTEAPRSCTRRCRSSACTGSCCRFSDATWMAGKRRSRTECRSRSACMIYRICMLVDKDRRRLSIEHVFYR